MMVRCDDMITAMVGTYTLAMYNGMVVIIMMIWCMMMIDIKWSNIGFGHMHDDIDDTHYITRITYSYFHTYILIAIT